MVRMSDIYNYHFVDVAAKDEGIHYGNLWRTFEYFHLIIPLNYECTEIESKVQRSSVSISIQIYRVSL